MHVPKQHVSPSYIIPTHPYLHQCTHGTATPFTSPTHLHPLYIHIAQPHLCAGWKVWLGMHMWTVCKEALCRLATIQEAKVHTWGHNLTLSHSTHSPSYSTHSPHSHTLTTHTLLIQPHQCSPLMASHVTSISSCPGMKMRMSP